ncbi:MAG: hypothetical protein ACFFAS_00535 [Promethearchaeota archaeon]
MFLMIKKLGNRSLFKKLFERTAKEIGIKGTWEINEPIIAKAVNFNYMILWRSD